jgi:hypothetical protein
VPPQQYTQDGDCRRCVNADRPGQDIDLSSQRSDFARQRSNFAFDHGKPAFNVVKPTFDVVKPIFYLDKPTFYPDQPICDIRKTVSRRRPIPRQRQWRRLRAPRLP